MDKGEDMELRQRARVDGVLMEQTAREYSPTDYDDVGPEFICKWLLRRFAGLNVVRETRRMLYHYMLENTGPTKTFPRMTHVAEALGVTPGTFRTYRYRLEANCDEE